jgi:hypothetical protein
MQGKPRVQIQTNKPSKFLIKTSHKRGEMGAWYFLAGHSALEVF